MMHRFRKRKFNQQFNEESTEENLIKSNILDQTRKMVLKMSQQKRFKKAQRHLQDALAYRNPRPDTFTQEMPFLLQKLYRIQTSNIWSWILFVCGYMYMYLIVLDSPNMRGLKLTLQVLFLILFFADIGMEYYHISHSSIQMVKKLPEIFYLRILILVLLSLDAIIFFLCSNIFGYARPIRPFRILRATLPLFYDGFIRKTFQALLSCYKDIIVYLMFYTMVIVGFSIVGNQVIQIPAGSHYDNFKENYINLDKIIFVLYVMSSYDAYPDNQLVAIRASIYNYAFFIIFVFFNVFFFVVIPATIIFNSFREKRSRIMLVDQIKQKHSLILCFITLGQDKMSLSHQKLIKFLLYIYKGKLRYIDHITQICLSLDKNNNGLIQAHQFMQLGKILKQNVSMMPPRYYDSKLWLKLRNFMNQQLKIGKIITSDTFRILNALFILATFINCCLYLSTGEFIFAVLDNIFMMIFIVQVFIKLVGLGIETYFEDKWNTLDFGLIITGLIIEIIPKGYQPHNSDVLFKMTRIFRITTLLKLIFRVKTSQKHNSIFRKIRQLLGQMTIIVPIIMKFFPLFMITYYVLGIVGMQVYYGETQIKPQNSPYSFYNQFSNFKSFMATQFIMVQVLVEAGWSLVAFDHAYRFGQYFLTMLYFVGIHMITVLILSALMKGLVWQVYFTVNQQYQQRLQQQQTYDLQQQKLRKMREEVEIIRMQTQGNLSIVPDTIIKKQLYENRIDYQILVKIKTNFINRLKSKKSSLTNSKQKIRIQQENQLKQQGKIKRKQSPKKNLKWEMPRASIVSHQIQKINLNQGQSKSMLHQVIQKDYQENIINQQNNSISLRSLDDQMQMILTSVILNPHINYSENIIYPLQFIQFLNSKFRQAENAFTPYENLSDSENQSQHQESERLKLKQPQQFLKKHSLNFVEQQINIMLGIQKSRRQQQQIILNNMLQQNLLKTKDLIELTKVRKYIRSKDEALQVDWVMRKTFLGDANEDKVKKFQIQYFSQIYGKSFREMNSVTIQPMLKYQATLTYCLRNLLRSQNTSQKDFFSILTTIQDSISNKLLKNGSIFKFVFQIDSTCGNGQNWFCVEYKKEASEIKIHFIKSGLWISNKNLSPGQIKFARDIFNWEDISQKNKDKQKCQKLIKRFYQSFQSLAFGLNERNYFFSIDPCEVVYDLYAFYTETKFLSRGGYFSEEDMNSKAQHNNKINISKMMVVILSKQQQRSSRKYLQYQLSDIKRQKVQKSKRGYFMKHKFSQSQDQTYEKLKQFDQLDEDMIIANEGLPFDFILNLMSQMKDMLDLYGNKMLQHVQSIFNKHYNNIVIQDDQKQIKNKIMKKQNNYQKNQILNQTIIIQSAKEIQKMLFDENEQDYIQNQLK